jgi:hypothetical protein
MQQRQVHVKVFTKPKGVNDLLRPNRPSSLHFTQHFNIKLKFKESYSLYLKLSYFRDQIEYYRYNNVHTITSFTILNDVTDGTLLYSRK